jgi:vacuolar-type H+-ATPase subunit H
MGSGWLDALASNNSRDWPSYRRALGMFRSSGPSYDQLTKLGQSLYEKIPGLTAPPSRGTWANSVQEVNRPVKWQYVELLIHAWSNYHQLPGEKTLELLDIWSHAFRDCGGDPGPRFPAKEMVTSQAESTGRAETAREALINDSHPQSHESPAASLNQLVSAQERTIVALEEVNRLKDAYVTSEKARQKAVQVGSVALALLGQARAEVARLNRKIDYIESTSAVPEGYELRTMQSKLKKAESRERDLTTQLEQAERDRDKYQQIADFAARRLSFLERELNRSTPREFSEYSTSFEALELVDDDTTPNDIDNAITQLRVHLNQESQVMQESADTIGWNPMFAAEGSRVADLTPNAQASNIPAESAGRVLALAQLTADQALADAKTEGERIIEESRRKAEAEEGSRGQRVLSLAQQTAEQAVAEARAEANRIVQEAQKKAEAIRKDSERDIPPPPRDRWPSEGMDATDGDDQ